MSPALTPSTRARSQSAASSGELADRGPQQLRQLRIQVVQGLAAIDEAPIEQACLADFKCRQHLVAQPVHVLRSQVRHTLPLLLEGNLQQPGQALFLAPR